MTSFSVLCWDPGSNWGPFALQANALPTELSQHIIIFFTDSLYARFDTSTNCILRLLASDVFEAKLLELSQHLVILLLSI